MIVHILAHDSEPSQRFVDDVLADEQVVKFIDEHFIPVTIYADDEPAICQEVSSEPRPSELLCFQWQCPHGRLCRPVDSHGVHRSTAADVQHHDQPGVVPIPGEPMPATPPVPVADRPGREQQTVDSDVAPVQMEGLKLLKESRLTSIQTN